MLRQFLVHVAGLHEHSEPVVQVAVGANRRRAQRVGGLHGDVEALERHGQRLRPEGVVELELLGVRGGGEALLLGEPGRVPRVALLLLLLLLHHGRRLGHRRRGRRPFGRHRRGGGRGCRLLGAPALGPVLLAGASCLRPALLRLVGGLQPLLEVRVPDVLDLVVRPSGQLGGDRGPPVAEL
uniref:ScMYB70 protein n=1 Tax=Saccharum hybrid cultivar Co 86032 TaxID=672234 RepID=A0A0C6WCQ5_9POAL|nr:ScMYB70 protein [Saccharum hybrid cultivar Co 86032]